MQISKEGVPKVGTPHLVLTSIKNKSYDLTDVYKKSGYHEKSTSPADAPYYIAIVDAMLGLLYA